MNSGQRQPPPRPISSTATTTRIPMLPRSTIKREADETLDNIQARESPSVQRLHRIASNDSPNKFRKPTLPVQLDGSPATNAASALSLAPNCRSPLAAPPLRTSIMTKNAGKNSSRLSMYGVPLSMMESKANSSTVRRMTMGFSGGEGEKRIVVCARKRPLSGSEMGVRGSVEDCVVVDGDGNKVKISVQRTKLDGLNKYNEDFTFHFDRAYDEHTGNDQIYGDIVVPLVKFCARGGKATCFAYGQTGSGKTHTMFNPKDGQCYLAISDLLRRKDKMIDCYVSFFEIYQGQLYDLMRGRKRVLPCERRDGLVKIMGLEEDLVVDLRSAKDAIQRGLQARMTGKTGANSQSSRSHAILQFTLRPRCQDAAGREDGDQIYGRMSFIDLAGSERGADRAEVDRRTKLEGSEINKSLLALKECIRALDQDAAHLPFRQSKLTLVLKNSIVGDVRTAMIATVSPATGSSEHSLNTLRYAERFHEISGNATGNALMADRENHDSDINDWEVSPIKPAATTASSLSSSRYSSPRKATNSRHVTPVKTVTFGIPNSVLEERRGQIYSILTSIHSQVQVCEDDDVLELLQEELSNISHAFQSLS